MVLDNKIWTKVIISLIVLAILTPLAIAFSGTGSIYTINKTTQGVSGDTGTGVYTIDGYITTPYQPGSYPATNNEQTANIGWYDITRGNVEPNITQIYITTSSGNNYTTESITCWANATDLDNQTLVIHFNWYNNTIKIPSLSGYIKVNRNNLNKISTLAPSNTTAGENWTCEAKAWDGYLNETDWNNASIIIIAAPIPPAGGSAGGGGGAGEVIHKEVPQPCTEAWICTEWSACTNSIKTRNCTDINNCPEPKFKPAETQQCRTIAETIRKEMTAEPQKAIPLAPKITPKKDTSIITTIKQTINTITTQIKHTLSTIKQAITSVIHKASQTALQNHIILKGKITSTTRIIIQNAQTISLTLNYLLLILTTAAMLIYFIKFHKQHRRSIRIRHTIYFLTGISLTGLLIHYTKFHQKTIPAYLAVIIILAILGIDWLLRTRPARIRKQQRQTQKIIEILQERKPEITTAKNLLKKLTRPILPKPADKIILIPQQKLTQTKKSISKMHITAEKLKQARQALSRIRIGSIQKIKCVFQKISKKKRAKFELSKGLKSLAEFDRKRAKYLKIPAEKAAAKEIKQFEQTRDAIQKTIEESRRLEQTFGNISYVLKEISPKQVYTRIKKDVITPITTSTQQIKQNIYKYIADKKKQKQRQNRLLEKQKQEKQKKQQILLRKIEKEKIKWQQEKQQEKELLEKQKQEKQKKQQIELQKIEKEKILRKIKQEKEKERQQQEKQQQKELLEKQKQEEQKKQQIELQKIEKEKILRKIKQEKEKERQQQEKQQQKEQKRKQKILRKQEKQKRKERLRTREINREIEKTKIFTKQLDKYLKKKPKKTKPKKKIFLNLKQEIEGLSQKLAKPVLLKEDKIKKKPKKLSKKARKEIEKTIAFTKKLDKYLYN